MRPGAQHLLKLPVSSSIEEWRHVAAALLGTRGTI